VPPLGSPTDYRLREVRGYAYSPDTTEEALEAITVTLDGLDRFVGVEAGLKELHAYILAALWRVDPEPQVVTAAHEYTAAARLARRGFLRMARPTTGVSSTRLSDTS
jgi:hypothetical protein